MIKISQVRISEVCSKMTPPFVTTVWGHTPMGFVIIRILCLSIWPYMEWPGFWLVNLFLSYIWYLQWWSLSSGEPTRRRNWNSMESLIDTGFKYMHSRFEPFGFPRNFTFSAHTRTAHSGAAWDIWQRVYYTHCFMCVITDTWSTFNGGLIKPLKLEHRCVIISHCLRICNYLHML